MMFTGGYVHLGRGAEGKRGGLEEVLTLSE